MNRPLQISEFIDESLSSAPMEIVVIMLKAIIGGEHDKSAPTSDRVIFCIRVNCQGLFFIIEPCLKKEMMCLDLHRSNLAVNHCHYRQLQVMRVPVHCYLWK